MTPEFWLFLPQMRMSFDTIIERVQRAEAEGFDGVAIMDHLAPPGVPHTDMFDAFVTAAALATHTERLRIGHLVLCASFRHPAVLAKMAVSLDHLSGGRFDLGIGWGSVPDELERFGVHHEPPAVRSARLTETLEVLEQLFTGEAFDHEGRFYSLRAAQQRPVPLQGRLPIVIGGGGRTLTMPLVARFADWWNVPSYAVHELDELRPLSGNTRMSTQHVVALAPTPDAVDEVGALARRRFADWRSLVIGTTDRVAAELATFARLGVERFYLMFADFANPDSLARFAREVIPAVRSAATDSVIS